MQSRRALCIYFFRTFDIGALYTTAHIPCIRLPYCRACVITVPFFSGGGGAVGRWGGGGSYMRRQVLERTFGTRSSRNPCVEMQSLNIFITFFLFFYSRVVW